MWVFDKCCGCIELRTGCFIIGYLQLVIQAITAIVTIIGLVVGTVLMNHPDQKIRNIGLMAVILSAILLPCLIPFLAVTITFVVGLHKNKPGHVKIYLICCLVFLVLSLFLMIIGITITDAVTKIFIAGQVITLLVNIYFLLVIRSYWLQMQNGNINSL